MKFARSFSGSKERSLKNTFLFLRSGILFFLLLCICNISFFPPIKQFNQVVVDKLGIRHDRDYSLLEVILEDVFGFIETDNEPEDDIDDLVKKIEYLFPVKTTPLNLVTHTDKKEFAVLKIILTNTILEKFTPPPRHFHLLS